MKAFEQIALPTLSRDLGLCFRHDPPQGYRDGKERIREMVMRFYDCDAEVAASLVNHLEDEGFIGLVDARGNRLRRRSRRKRRTRVEDNTTAHWRFAQGALKPS